MKRVISIIPMIFLASILMLSCSASGKVAEPGRDGLSFETAIIVNSVDREYEWIRKNYPGSQPVRQVLTEYKKRHYDIITIKTPSGEESDIHFDISRFFGRGF